MNIVTVYYAKDYNVSDLLKKKHTQHVEQKGCWKMNPEVSITANSKDHSKNK